MNDIGRVSFKLAQPLSADPYATSRSTGAFIVIDEASNNTVGAGMIL
jgi:sulfate adenylyltransferase subunit 1